MLNCLMEFCKKSRKAILDKAVQAHCFAKALESGPERSAWKPFENQAYKALETQLLLSFKKFPFKRSIDVLPLTLYIPLN